MAVRFTLRFQARSRSAYRSRSAERVAGEGDAEAPRAPPAARRGTPGPCACDSRYDVPRRPIAFSTSSRWAARYSSTSASSSAEVAQDALVDEPEAAPGSASPAARTSGAGPPRRRASPRCVFGLATYAPPGPPPALRRDDEELAEDPLALAARRDALDVDEREVDLPPLAGADGRDARSPCRSASRVAASRSAIAFTAGSPSSRKPPTSRFTHLRPSARGFTTRFTRYCTASTSAEESSTALPLARLERDADRLRRLLHLDVHRRAEPREQLARRTRAPARPSPARRPGAAASSSACARPWLLVLRLSAAATARPAASCMYCCWAIESTLFTKM